MSTLANQTGERHGGTPDLDSLDTRFRTTPHSEQAAGLDAVLDAIAHPGPLTEAEREEREQRIIASAAAFQDHELCS